MMLSVLIACVLVAGGASAAQSIKGVFESCPACKLDTMPELKRFFHESVLKGEYGDKLSVKFVPGATPKLILYAADGTEVSREDVSDKLKYDELHKWVQGKGFKKDGTAATVSSANSKASQQKTPAPHPDTAATKPPPAAAAAGRGQRQHQRPRDGPVGPLQRRRRLNPDTRGQRQRGAAAAAAGGEGGMRRRRRRRRAAVKGGEGAGGGSGAAAGGGGAGGQTRVRWRRRRAAAAGPGEM